MDPGYSSTTNSARPESRSGRNSGKTRRGVARGIYFVTRPGPSKRLPGPRGSAIAQRAAFQIAAGTSGSGIHAAAERSKYVRQAMALYEAQTYEPQKAAHLQPHGSRILLHDELCQSTKTVQEEFRENEARNRKRNLLRQSACGLVSGKRSEELQDDTSSVGLAHQSVFPDRAVAPAFNAPPFRLQPAPSPAPADPGSVPRPSEVNTSDRRRRPTKRRPSKELKASSPAPCPI